MKALRVIFLILSCPLVHGGPNPFPGNGVIHPRLSPNGRHAACSYQGAIAVGDVRLGGTRKILTRGEGFDIQPAWSADGKRLAFINTANFRQGQLRLLSMPDGYPLKLPAVVRAQGWLYFHPDGNQLLGRFSKAGFPNALGWLNVKTGALKPVAIKGIDPGRLTTWRLAYTLTPDGKSIVLATNLDIRGEQGGNNGPLNDLWLVPAQGCTAKKSSAFPLEFTTWKQPPTGTPSTW